MNIDKKTDIALKLLDEARKLVRRMSPGLASAGVFVIHIYTDWDSDSDHISLVMGAYNTHRLYSPNPAYNMTGKRVLNFTAANVSTIINTAIYSLLTEFTDCVKRCDEEDGNVAS